MKFSYGDVVIVDDKFYEKQNPKFWVLGYNEEENTYKLYVLVNEIPEHEKIVWIHEDKLVDFIETENEKEEQKKKAANTIKKKSKKTK